MSSPREVQPSFRGHARYFRAIVHRLFGAIALLALCATALPSFAQSLGFGSITGVVQDSTGAVVQGAKVTVSNPSKGITREMDTSSSGAFSAPALVPASGYAVSVSKGGFAPVEITSITVQVGETVNLNPVMKVAGTTEQVEVTMTAPLVDTTKVDTSSVVNSDQILGLPTSGRRVDQFVLLTPGVTNDGAFGLLSFRGNPGGNSFLTDGVDTTNSYYDENAGRTRTYNISQDAVQEFEVVSSNFLAEFGKASGGVVNTVTRSGSNSYHGTAYWFFRNTTLAAKDRLTVSSLLPNGINPPSYRHLAGMSIGGPIKKDKLFFFFNGELLRRVDPAFSSNIGTGAGNNLFTSPCAINTARNNCVPGGSIRLPSGALVPGPTAQQCSDAIAFLSGRALPQLVSRRFDNNLLFGKVDYHPTSKDAISISGNYLDFRSPNGIQSSGLSFTNGNAVGNNSDTNVFDRTGRASWIRILTPNTLNELRYGFFVDRQWDPGSPSLLPSWGAFGTSPVALTLDGVSNLGYATNYPRLNPRETRNEISDNLSWTKGQHNFKFGGTVSNVADHVISMFSQFPTYSYSAVSGGANALTLFALDYNGTTPQGNQAWTSYSQTVGNRQIDYDLWETSLYAQDQWRLTPKLTITPGLRFEHTTIPQPTVCNPLFPQTCKIPDSHNSNVAPRFGIAYALNSKTAIHAGYGMFFNRFTTAAIENLLITNGVYQLGYSNPTIVGGSGANSTYNQPGHGFLGCLPTFPNLLPFSFVATGACAKTITPSVIYADNTYRPAYSEQATLAVDRELFKNTSLSVSYVWSRSLHIPVSYDTNVSNPAYNLTYKVLDSTGAVVNTYTTPIYTAFNPAYTFSGSQYKGRVSVYQSAANSYYNALLVNLKHRYSNWLEGDLAYTWGHTIDWAGVGFAPTFGSTTPSSYVDGCYRCDKGSSQLDRRHLLVINAVVSPTFMHSNGWFAKQVVNGWSLSFITTLASSQPAFPGFFSVSMPTSGATGTAIATANGFPLGTSLLNSGSLNGLGGLGRIPFESMSALNLGAWYRTDARIAKTFPITEQWKVSLGMEAFNLFNSLIPTSRDFNQYQQAFPTSGPNLGFATLTPRPSYGTVTATVDPLNGTNARRANAFVRITW
ncbi:MAG: TonB-dependent receptor [Terriglobales bacterium]